MVKFLFFFQLAFKNLRRFRGEPSWWADGHPLRRRSGFNNSLGNGIEDQLLKNLVTLQPGTSS